MKRKPSGLYGPEGLLFAGERRLWFPCGGRFYIGPVHTPGGYGIRPYTVFSRRKRVDFPGGAVHTERP